LIGEAILSDPTQQAAELLALDVFDLVADYCHDPASVTADDKAAIRTSAFRFSRTVTPSDSWFVALGRRMAGAALEWANDSTAENFRALARASRAYEAMRINPPADKIGT
jgi:hypothetical protein